MCNIPILGFLMESEMTGYDLKRRFQDPIGFFYRVSDGSLYPALKRMALDGLVTMRSERHGRRTRKVYAITPAGRARFLKTLREPAQPLFIYDESQIKIYFAEHDPQAALEHLDRAGREDAEVVKMLTWLAGEMKRRGDSPFRQIVVEARTRGVRHQGRGFHKADRATETRDGSRRAGSAIAWPRRPRREDSRPSDRRS